MSNRTPKELKESLLKVEQDLETNFAKALSKIEGLNHEIELLTFIAWLNADVMDNVQVGTPMDLVSFTMMFTMRSVTLSIVSARRAEENWEAAKKRIIEDFKVNSAKMVTEMKKNNDIVVNAISGRFGDLDEISKEDFMKMVKELDAKSEVKFQGDFSNPQKQKVLH